MYLWPFLTNVIYEHIVMKIFEDSNSFNFCHTLVCNCKMLVTFPTQSWIKLFFVNPNFLGIQIFFWGVGGNA